MHPILIVDDEVEMRIAMSETLKHCGYPVEVSHNALDALNKFKKNDYAMVVTDMTMPKRSGLELLKDIKALNPDIPVLMVTAYATIETAIEAMKQGAFEYIQKPFKSEVFTFKVDRALSQAREKPATKAGAAKKAPAGKEKPDTGSSEGKEMITADQNMLQLLGVAENVAQSKATILVQSESGTGKELLAKAIHKASPRHNKPFVAINCSAMAENLLESELFGHEKGAFTGATSMKRGKFELADGGTLFLDEIGDMSLATQAKVLRVIQEQQFTRVGGTKLLNVNVRVIAASNKDLVDEIGNGNFREDLYYRINVLPIVVPTLKEHREDIPELAQHFLKMHAEEQGMKPKEFNAQGLAALQRHDWPGNIRELRNLIERLLIMAPKPVIDAADVEMFLQGRAPTGVPTFSVGTNYASLREARNVFEREVISQKLKENNWNVSKTADELKIERSHLHRKIKLLNVQLRPEQ